MMAGPAGEKPEASTQELSRDLGFYAVFTTATGTMIGAGIFILPGVAAQGAGPGAALSFLFAGIIAGLAALSVCELATAMPKAGGPYYFVSRAMGPLMGTIVGLGAWLALILKGSFALVGLGQYVFHFSSLPILATAAVGGLLLVGVNLVGAKATGALQNVTVLVLLGILGVFVMKGLMAADMATLRPLLPFGWSGVVTTTGVVFISYLGIVKAAAIAEEVVNPERNLPLGILTSVVLVTFLYVCTMVIVTGVLPMESIASATAPLADAGQIFLGVTGGILVGVAGILATISTGNAAILSSSRYPFAMARDALMTPWIRRIHPRFQTPARSIMVTGGIMVALALLLDVERLAKLGGVFGMLVFSLVNVSVLVLRKTAPDWYRPSFRVPLYPILPLLGAAAALAPIPQLGLFSHVAAVGFVALGVGWYYRQRKLMDGTNIAIQPEYGLRDQWQEIRQIQALEVKRKVLRPAALQEPAEISVVAELAEGMPNKHLLALAAAMARKHASAVDAIMVTEVPYQSPLESPVLTPSPDWVNKVRARMEAYGVPLRFHHLLARNKAHAILSFAQPETRIILLDWHDEFRPVRIRGSYVDRVLQASPSRVAILKYRGHKSYNRILVATAGSPYAPSEVEMGDSLARLTNARLTLLMVLPTEASATREERARAYLQSLGELTESNPELQVVRGDDVTQAILHAGQDHDLIVLGATREFLFRHLFDSHLVGRIADEIAEKSTGSVLVVKNPGGTERMASRMARWLAGRWNRLRGRPPESRVQLPATPEDAAVEPFSRHLE